MTAESGGVTSRENEGSPTPGWSDVLESARSAPGLTRVRDLVRVCETVITRAGLTGFNSMGTPRKDARAIVFETLAISDHSDTYLDAVVTPVERAAVLDLLGRRVSGPTPVPYLLGEAFFAGRRFTVRPGVFIPRSALGLLLDDVLPVIRWSTPPRALELGCGTGALGISIAIRVPQAQVDLVDVDALAVEVTATNIARHNVADRARTAVSDMYAGVDPTARYDLIVANLPYVPADRIGRTNREIDAEPQAAVYRPDDGLDLIRIALDESALHLADNGVLFLEVGVSNQAGVDALVGTRGRWWTLDGQGTGVVSLSRDDLKA